jgi:hypothetical protein
MFEKPTTAAANGARPTGKNEGLLRWQIRCVEGRGSVRCARESQIGISGL